METDKLRKQMTRMRREDAEFFVSFSPPLPAALSANQDPQEGDVQAVEELTFKLYNVSCPSCNTRMRFAADAFVRKTYTMRCPSCDSRFSTTTVL